MNDLVFTVAIGTTNNAHCWSHLSGSCLCLEVQTAAAPLVGPAVPWICLWRTDTCTNTCNTYSMTCKYTLYVHVGSSILCISRTKGRIISFTCFLFLLTKKVYVYSVIHGIFLGLWRMHFWVCNWLHMTNMKAGIYPSCQATSSIVCWVKNLRS